MSDDGDLSFLTGFLAEHVGNLDEVPDTEVSHDRPQPLSVKRPREELSSEQRSALRRISFDATLSSASTGGLELPWESSQMRLIFGPPDLQVFPTMNVLAEDVLAENFIVTDGRAPSREVAKPKLHEKTNRFRFRTRDLHEDEKTTLVLEKWRLIILHAPEASQVGRMITTVARPEQLRIIAEALGGKSMATLKKRLSQVTRIFVWSESMPRPIHIFPITVDVVHGYFKFLKDQNCGHSVLQGALECIRFLEHVIGVEVHKHAASSVWVKGMLRFALANRKQRKQSRPLTVAELNYLERFLADEGNSLQDRYAIGCCLFAIYSRARVGDLAALASTTADIFQTQDGRWHGHLEAQSNSHKMRATSSALGLNLALIAPVQGVSNRPWGIDFIEVAKATGLQFGDALSSARPLLPVPDPAGQWTNLAVASAEMGRWLKICLAGSENHDPTHLTSHGMKATTLSSLAKWGGDPVDRQILGHHSLKDRKSLKCYSRDIQAGPLRSLEKCLHDIRHGTFRPDRTRSGHFPPSSSTIPAPESARSDRSEAKSLDSVATASENEDRSESESSTSSSSSSSSGAKIDVLERAAGRANVEEQPDWKAGHRIFQHKRTRKLHLIRFGHDRTSFVCGRNLTEEHSEFRGRILMVSWKCIQCERGRPARELAEAAMARAIQKCKKA